MPKTIMEKNLKKEERFKRQYNSTLNYFFTRVLSGVTGVSYVPEVCVIPQFHSDHLPNLMDLEERAQTEKRTVDIYIPDLDKTGHFPLEVMKRYYVKLLGMGRAEADQNFGTNLQSRMAGLQREFNYIKIKTCGRIIQYDGIRIEFLETYEAPSPRHHKSSMVMSMILEENGKIPVCLESEENQIAYIGEAVIPPERIYEILTELNPENGEVILTPPHPEYDRGMIQDRRIVWSTEDIDSERQKITTTYNHISPELRDLLALIERDKNITLSISLDPCHAEGVFKKPDLPALIQTIPCIEKSLFIEKNKKAKYVFDNSGHHYLAWFLKHHYELPSVHSKEI